MTEYEIHGVPHNPDAPSVPIAGIWTIRDYDQCVCTDPADLSPLLVRPVSVYASGNRDVSVTLPETTGNRLYWLEFTSNDRSLTIGPLLFTLTQDRTWDDIIANPAPVPSGGGGGGFDFTGEGSPLSNGLDPAVVGVGKTYLDTEFGCLYIVFLNPEGPTPEWGIVGGEIDGDMDAEGFVLGNGVSVVGKSLNGRQVAISDVGGYNGSGNGIYWTGTGTDGEQGVTILLGAVGVQVSALTFYSDGSSEFGKDAYFDQATHADGAIGTRAAEPADADIRNGECFRWFDSTNGAAKVMFKGKTADGTVVEATVAMS